MKLFVVPKDNVFVVHCAAGSHFKPSNQKEAHEYVARRYDISQNYILYVGTIDRRKNIPALLKAFHYGVTVLGLNHQLVIAGGQGWGMPSLCEMAKELGLAEKYIKVLGYVPESDLPFLYSGADVFVFPSAYEGFGIPVLEAMSCGCPVIISSAAALKEVVDASGVIVDPSDTASFAKAIMKVVSDRPFNQLLRENSLKRAPTFSWDKSGCKMLEILTTNWDKSRK
jgi:glycosyltransferase involved in cell wall biosynthesis